MGWFRHRRPALQPRLRRRFVFTKAAGGPSTYNESVSESISTLGVMSAAGSVFDTAVTDSVTLADAAGETVGFATAISEAAALADSVGVGAAFNAGVDEALNLTDSEDGASVLGVSVSEAVTLEDIETVLAAYEAVTSEVLALTESPSVQASMSDGVSESLALLFRALEGDEGNPSMLEWHLAAMMMLSTEFDKMVCSGRDGNGNPETITFYRRKSGDTSDHTAVTFSLTWGGADLLTEITRA